MKNKMKKQKEEQIKTTDTKEINTSNETGLIVIDEKKKKNKKNKKRHLILKTFLILIILILLMGIIGMWLFAGYLLRMVWV